MGRYLRAIMALRFHGQETNVVPRPRLAASFRLMLERRAVGRSGDSGSRPLAGLVGDGKVVKLFKEAKEDTLWVRVPVINYLRHCPRSKAKEYVERIAGPSTRHV